METCPPVLNLQPRSLGHHRLEQSEGFGNTQRGRTLQWRHPGAVTVLPMMLLRPVMQLGAAQDKQPEWGLLGD